MNDVLIKEVKSAAERRVFVDYPNRLYRDCDQFVPAFFGDDMDDLDPDKNPAFSYCDVKLFLAYRDGEVVGRIGAILSRKANEKFGAKRMRFSQVDFIDDREVSKALFDAVEDWAREKGMNEVHGPLGFCDLNREGMLVEGFDKRGTFFTYYNHPYYIDHLTALGYEKDVDWIEHLIPLKGWDDPNYLRLKKISDKALKMTGCHKVVLKKRAEYKPWIHKIFKLINTAYAPLYGVVELSEEQIQKFSDQFIPIIDPDFCCLIADENDELMGLGIGAPSMAEAMKKCRGHLFPFGWIGVLRSLKKNDTLDLFFIAVRPELEKTGLNGVVMEHMFAGCNKHGIIQAETGPQLELNRKVHSQWKMFGIEPQKRRRCFIKKL